MCLPPTPFDFTLEFLAHAAEKEQGTNDILSGNVEHNIFLSVDDPH